MNELKNRAYISMLMSYPQQYHIIKKYFTKYQVGGAIKQIKFNNYLFNVNISNDNDGLTISVIVPNENNPRECVIILVDIENKMAIIQGISKISECVIPAFVGPDGFGSLLLKFSLSFLRTYKKKFKINRIVLQDNSLKPCNHCNQRIRMADMHFLINGDTWYGKYGFRPFDPPNNKPDNVDLHIYNKNKKIIADANTSDVPLYEMIEETVHKLKITNIKLDNIKKFVKHNKNQKLSKVIKLFYDKYEIYCCVFTVIAPKIMESLGMTSFYGKNFYLDI